MVLSTGIMFYSRLRCSIGIHCSHYRQNHANQIQYSILPEINSTMDSHHVSNHGVDFTGIIPDANFYRNQFSDTDFTGKLKFN